MVRNMNIEKNAAPVAVFVYNRLEHTKRLFESLKKNKYADYSDVYIFSDGAKNSKDQSVYNKNKIQVAQVRDYISKIKGFKNVYITYREKNYGLAKNIISGVTDVLTKSNKIIVLEDDLVVSSAFLVYMNLALDRYEHEERVYSVSGYSYINKRFIKNRMPETFFCRLHVHGHGVPGKAAGFSLILKQKAGSLYLTAVWKEKGLILEIQLIIQSC